MIGVRVHGNFNHTEEYLKGLASKDYRPILEKYAKIGLDALRDSTPVDSGLTRDSWVYKIQNDQNGITIIWENTNLINGTPLIILLQYGHATGTGGYVEGYDFINPAIRPIFDELAEKLWKEVRR